MREGSFKPGRSHLQPAQHFAHDPSTICKNVHGLVMNQPLVQVNLQPAIPKLSHAIVNQPEPSLKSVTLIPGLSNREFKAGQYRIVPINQAPKRQFGTSEVINNSP